MPNNDDLITNLHKKGIFLLEQLKQTTNKHVFGELTVEVHTTDGVDYLIIDGNPSPIPRAM